MVTKFILATGQTVVIKSQNGTISMRIGQREHTLLLSDARWLVDGLKEAIDSAHNWVEETRKAYLAQRKG
jgi:hypothetical protein